MTKVTLMQFKPSGLYKDINNWGILIILSIIVSGILDGILNLITQNHTQDNTVYIVIFISNFILWIVYWRILSVNLQKQLIIINGGILHTKLVYMFSTKSPVGDREFNLEKIEAIYFTQAADYKGPQIKMLTFIYKQGPMDQITIPFWSKNDIRRIFDHIHKNFPTISLNIDKSLLKV